MSIEIKLGGGATQAIGRFQAQKEEVLTTLSSVLMKAGLPGAFSIPLPENVGGGNLNFRPLISRKDGRIMYNMSVKGGTIGKDFVVLTGGGNLFLPKQGWTVDATTLKVYQEASAGIETERSKSKAALPTMTEAEALEEGESTD